MKAVVIAILITVTLAGCSDTRRNKLSLIGELEKDARAGHETGH